jgi:hypothetical protein
MGLPANQLADGERSLLVLRPHVLRLLRPGLILAVLVAARWVVWPFLVWWNTVYVLTDERLFERHGVLRRTGHDLPLQGVTDVVVAQRFGERLLRSGSLRVITEGGGELAVTDVPAVSRLQRALLAVADDVSERLRGARDHRWNRRAGDVDHAVDHWQPDEDAAAWSGADWADDKQDGDDGLEDADGAEPSRREVRRRDRENMRRLKDLQAQVRRTPLPDSPLEDEGLQDEGLQDERVAPATRPPADPPQEPAAEGHAAEGHDAEGDDAEGDAAEGDDAEGARILRFPQRP